MLNIETLRPNRLHASNTAFIEILWHHSLLSADHL
jgi:hypothetical protein